MNENEAIVENAVSVRIDQARELHQFLLNIAADLEIPESPSDMLEIRAEPMCYADRAAERLDRLGEVLVECRATASSIESHMATLRNLLG